MDMAVEILQLYHFHRGQGTPPIALSQAKGTSPTANRYTRLENLAWSHAVFIQFSFCRKRRYMKPLLLSSIKQLNLFNPLPPLML